MRETVKLGVRLMLFALVAGLLLAVVNAVTEEPIARNERLKADGSRIAVIGDYDFEALQTDTTGYDAIQSAVSYTHLDVYKRQVRARRSPQRSRVRRSAVRSRPPRRAPWGRRYAVRARGGSTERAMRR